MCQKKERALRGSRSVPESKLHINYLEIKAVFLALKEFQDLYVDKILVATDNTTIVSYINKEGSMRLGPLCALLWRILTRCTQQQVTLKSLTHPRSTKCGSRQAIQTGSDYLAGMVPPSRGFSNVMQQMAPASDRPICHKFQPQVTSVCVSSTGPPSCSSGCTHSAIGGSGCISLPTDRHIGQSGGEVTGFPMQENHSDCSGWPNMPWF